MVTKLCCDACGTETAPTPGGGAQTSHEVYVESMERSFKVTVQPVGVGIPSRPGDRADLCLHCRMEAAASVRLLPQYERQREAEEAAREAAAGIGPPRERKGE